MSLRSRRFAAVALLSLVACENLEEPRARGATSPSGPSPKLLTSAIGTLDGTIYYSLCNLDLQGFIYRVNPNGGSAPLGIQRGTEVRASSTTRRIAVRDEDAGAIFTADTDGTHIRNLGFFNRGDGRLFSWSPNGKQVAAIWRGGPNGPEILVYDDNDNLTHTEQALATSQPEAAGLSGFDWRGTKWVVDASPQVTPPPGYFNQDTRVVAVTTPPSATFSNLWVPQFIAGPVGVWSPMVDGLTRIPDATGFGGFFANVNGGIRLDAAGNVYWAGIDFSTNKRGIYRGTNTFYLNTGETGAFAFSPKGDAMAAVRMFMNSDGSTTYNLDVLDLTTGAYVRTLKTSTALGLNGLMICSVDWMPPQANLTPPLAGITYRGTGTANEFMFDGSGSTATTTGATISSYAWDFGDGTTGSGATVTHAFQSPGARTITLKVTDSNGLDASTSVTLSAQLTIATVTPSSDVLSVGDHFTLDVDVRNDGGVPITGVTPSAAITPSAMARVDSGPKPVSVDLAAGTHQHFTFYATALAAGSGNAVVDASGAGPSGTVNAQQRQRNLTVNGAGIGVQLAATPQIPDAGSQFTVTVTLTNLGTVDLVNIVGVLTTNPTAGINLVGSTPASITRLAPGAKADLMWKVTDANPGQLAVSVLASGREDNAAAAERRGSSTFTVAIADRRLVVTTTGDETLDDQHLTDKICDVDPKSDGNQCTLRAALQLAKALGGAQTIAFNISGSGVPTITPASPLPSIETPLTVDGSSQPGGWVELSGAGAGDGANGLAIFDGPTTIRGLVVNDWKGSGISFRRGQGHVVIGNRIGTNASGTAARANNTGIRVTSADVRIGGTVGTSATACTGDCNLISGNNSDGVLIGSRGTAAVLGNYIGTNLTGNAVVGNASGVSVSVTDADVPGAVQIGAATSAAGRAPGNLISGNRFRAIDIGAGTGHEIAGNLIGLDRTGTALLLTFNGGTFSSAGETGIEISGGTASRPVSAVVGGPAGRGNVISGFQYFGINASSQTGNQVIVQGNRIGTTSDGSALAAQAPLQISNGWGEISTGVHGWGVGYGEGRKEGDQGVLEVRDNLISGNATGIAGATLAVGNMIGTDVTGTRAIPNALGIGNVQQVGGVRPAGSRRCESPCNLISGNGTGVTTSQRVQGNFLGTDITGLRAIPNAEGMSYIEDLGGPSGAVIGICDRACNLISSSRGNAVVLTGGTVQGNVIGAGIDGSALGNGLLSDHGGSGIVVQLGRVMVGGDADLGNVISNNRSDAVSVSGPNGSQIDGVIVRGNSITDNGAGITYWSGATAVPKSPRIISAIRNGASTTITGALSDFSSGNAFGGRIDVYASLPSACRPGMNPQGTFPIGFVTVGPISDGQWSLTVDNLPVGLTGITATWTVGSFTSPFSSCGSVTTGDPAQPAITQSASAGSDRIEVSSTAGFSVGGWAKINAPHAATAATSVRRANLISTSGADVNNTEWKKIRAFGSLIFTSPLAFDHAVGEPVEPAEAPPAAGWLFSMTGEVTPFGGAPALAATNASQRTLPLFAATPTPTGRGLWALTANGAVQTYGDAASFGDASSLMTPSETAVSLLPISNHGYLIVTNRGRVLPFGNAASLGDSPRPANDQVTKAVLMPSRRGYLFVTACGGVIGMGDVGNLSAPSAGRCNVVGAAVPNSGVGVWLLHADGRVDALGGAPSFSQTNAVPNGVSIAAQADGYVVTDAIGRMYAFGVAAPAAVSAKAPILAILPVPH